MSQIARIPQRGLISFRSTLKLVVVLVATLPTFLPSAQVASPLYEIEPVPLKITTTDGSVVELQTVVVRSRAHQQQGLMNIRHLPINQSMLFLNQPPRRMSMWMKNTYVSLDLWFVLPNQTIGHIASRTEPLSLDSISYDQPVLAVIEVNAGLSRLLGVSPGAQVKF